MHWRVLQAANDDLSAIIVAVLYTVPRHLNKVGNFLQTSLCIVSAQNFVGDEHGHLVELLDHIGNTRRQIPSVSTCPRY